MSLKKFVPIAGGGALLDALQDLLLIIIDELQENRVANDHLIEGITLDLGVDVPIYHGLGQPIRTWDIVRQSADATIWEGAASVSPRHFFNLTASGPVTVTVRCT